MAGLCEFVWYCDTAFYRRRVTEFEMASVDENEEGVGGDTDVSLLHASVLALSHAVATRRYLRLKGEW